MSIKALVERQQAISNAFPQQPTPSQLRSLILTNEQAITAVEGDVSQLQQDVNALDGRVTALEPAP